MDSIRPTDSRAKRFAAGPDVRLRLALDLRAQAEGVRAYFPLTACRREGEIGKGGWRGSGEARGREKVCSEDEWRRAYSEINDFEDSLRETNTVVVKLWIQID